MIADGIPQQVVDMGAGDDIKEEEEEHEADQEGHLHCTQECFEEYEASIASEEVDDFESKAPTTAEEKEIETEAQKGHRQLEDSDEVVEVLEEEEEDTVASGHQDQRQHAPPPGHHRLEPAKVQMRLEREAKRTRSEFERLRAEMRALRTKTREELHRKASKRKRPPPR
jgi:hypothetical protein